MNALLLTAVFAFSQDPQGLFQVADQPAPAPATTDRQTAAQFDGNWTILAVEHNGQPAQASQGLTVNIKDGMVTFPGAPADTLQKAKLRPMKVQFGPNGQLTVREANDRGVIESAGGETKKGTYIVTQEYLAVCVHDETLRPGTPGTPGAAPAGDTKLNDAAKFPGGNRCTVFLKRAEAGRLQPQPSP